MHVMSFGYANLLQEMIENTWKWARENNKIIKHPISGGEFVDIDVEHVMQNMTEKGNRMSQQSATHFQAGASCCMHTWTAMFSQVRTPQAPSWTFRRNSVPLLTGSRMKHRP